VQVESPMPLRVRSQRYRQALSFSGRVCEQPELPAPRAWPPLLDLGALHTISGPLVQKPQKAEEKADETHAARHPESREATHETTALVS
jgi:hypothetical protein